MPSGISLDPAPGAGIISAVFDRRPSAAVSRAPGGPSSHRVYRELRHEILGGALPEGTRLVELELAARFGVSRTPVREALQRLVAEGLVTQEPDVGLTVRSVAPKEIDEIHAIRAVLEGQAARLAAERATSQDIMKLRAIAQVMRGMSQTEDWSQWPTANTRFHDAVSEIAGNRRLRMLTLDLKDFVRRFSRTGPTDARRATELLAEHEAIIDALEARDPARAEEAARGHVHGARPRPET